MKTTLAYLIFDFMVICVEAKKAKRGLLQVAYCVDMDKSVIIGNMEKRGWVPVGPDDDWQVYWASTQTCRQALEI